MKTLLVPFECNNVIKFLFPSLRLFQSLLLLLLLLLLLIF